MTSTKLKLKMGAAFYFPEDTNFKKAQNWLLWEKAFNSPAEVLEFWKKHQLENFCSDLPQQLPSTTSPVNNPRGIEFFGDPNPESNLFTEKKNKTSHFYPKPPRKAKNWGSL